MTHSSTGTLVEAANGTQAVVTAATAQPTRFVLSLTNGKLTNGYRQTASGYRQSAESLWLAGSR